MYCMYYGSWKLLMYFFFKWDIFKIKLRIYEYNIKKNKSIEVAYFSVEKM